MVVYTSAWPSVPIIEESIFSHVFNSNLCAPGQVVYIDGPTGQRFTQTNVKHAALSLAHGLRNELHAPNFGGPLLSRGDTVMIFSQNNILYPVFMWGTFAAGLRATPASIIASPNEVKEQWVDSGSKVMIVSSSLVHTALGVFKLLNLSPEDALRKIVVYSDGENLQLLKGFKFIRYEDLSARGLLSKEEPFCGQLSYETALLCYSSGTSGKSKGVEVNPSLHPSTPPLHIIAESIDPSRHSLNNDVLILVTLADHAQEPRRAIGYALVDWNSRNARSVNDLPDPILPRIWGGELFNVTDSPRRGVCLDAKI